MMMMRIDDDDDDDGDEPTGPTAFWPSGMAS
jgi:hypothetical protein